MSVDSGRAAELPEGSVVANYRFACIKSAPDNWLCTDRRVYSDAGVDIFLSDVGVNDEATVLRVGDSR